MSGNRNERTSNLSVSISELSVCPWKPNDWLPGLWIVVGAGKGKLCKAHRAERVAGCEGVLSGGPNASEGALLDESSRTSEKAAVELAKPRVDIGPFAQTISIRCFIFGKMMQVFDLITFSRSAAVRSSIGMTP